MVPTAHWAGETGVFKPASRANLCALNRAVFSCVAKRAASYSALACCPSRSCASFFLKIASALSRAWLALMANLVTPFRANPPLGQTSLRSGCTSVDVGLVNGANAFAGYLFRLSIGDRRWTACTGENLEVGAHQIV